MFSIHAPLSFSPTLSIAFSYHLSLSRSLVLFSSSHIVMTFDDLTPFSCISGIAHIYNCNELSLYTESLYHRIANK